MRVFNDRDIVSRASFILNPGLEHNTTATHLTYSTTQNRLSTALDRYTFWEVPKLLLSYVPLLEVFADHSMVAYRAHDLEAVQAGQTEATNWEKPPLGWD